MTICQKNQTNLPKEKGKNLESKINRITDILRRDDGISGVMHYSEKMMIETIHTQNL